MQLKWLNSTRDMDGRLGTVDAMVEGSLDLWYVSLVQQKLTRVKVKSTWVIDQEDKLARVESTCT